MRGVVQRYSGLDWCFGTRPKDKPARQLIKDSKLGCAGHVIGSIGWPLLIMNNTLLYYMYMYTNKCTWVLSD